MPIVYICVPCNFPLTEWVDSDGEKHWRCPSCGDSRDPREYPWDDESFED